MPTATGSRPRLCRWRSRARGDGLAELLAYWDRLKERGVPRFTDIDPVKLSQLGLFGRLHVLDASNPDPAQIRFALYGHDTPLDGGRDYAGFAVGDHPIRIYGQAVADSYDAVRAAGEPAYARIRKGLAGMGHHYARLVLPFSTGRRRIDRLLVAIRPEPDDGVPLDRD